MRLLAFALVLVVLLCSVVLAAAPPFNDIQLKVFFSDRSELSPLLALGVDVVWTDSDYVEVVTNPDQAEHIAKLGLRTETVHESVSEFYQSRFTDKDQGGYKTLSELNAYLDGIVADHPNIVSTKVSIGQTIQGRDIWAAKISDNPNVDEDEPEALFTAAIHCREVATPEVLFNAMDYLTENYATDPDVQELVDSRELWFIILCNPDGYYYNEITAPNGGGMWRKNRRDNGDGTYGIDLNRNFGFGWGYDDFGSSPNTISDIYRGTAPFSEPETQALRDFTLAHDFTITCYFHSYQNVFIYPWGYIASATEDQDIYGAMGDSIFMMNGYVHGPVSTLMYQVNGGTFDWEYGAPSKPKIFGTSIEVGGYTDGFWPTLTRLEEIKAENLDPILFLARMAGELYALRAPVPPVMSEQTSPVYDGNYTVEWTHDDDDNPAVGFQLVELQDRRLITDPAETSDNWNFENFAVSTARYASSPTSYHSLNVYGEPVQLTTQYPHTIGPRDDLTFDIYYDLNSQVDYMYVEVSTDGETFVSIPGNITSDFNPYGYNLGNGISGTLGYWEHAEFDLSSWIGQSLYFRFEVIGHSSYPGEGVYLDNISPHLTFGSTVSLGSDLTELSMAFTDKPRGVYYYLTRALDAEDQWSTISNVIKIDVPRPGIGDPDLDGISGTIADQVLFDNLQGYGPGVLDVYPETQLAETDFNCDGIMATDPDLNTLREIVLNPMTTPCYISGQQAEKRVPESVAQSAGEYAAAPGNFAVTMDCTDFPKTDSAWVDIDLTSADGGIVGYHFQVHYDASALEFTDVTLGDELGNWQYLDYNQMTATDIGWLNVAAQAWDQGDPVTTTDIDFAALPATLVRIHFRYLDPGENHEIPVTFAWVDCGDNGLVLGRVESGQVVLDSLGLSNQVLDENGLPVTSMNPLYTGAKDSCFAESFGSMPARLVDFQNGMLLHDGSCCVDPVGDANGDGNSEPTIGDISYLIDALFIAEDPSMLACLMEADVNQSGGADPNEGDITIGDISYLIDYLFITGESLGLYNCPF